jgi:hypothetical protein
MPLKRDYDPNLGGESSSNSWADDELEGAFDANLDIPSLDTITVDPFQVIIPSNLAEASKEGFFVEIKPNGVFEFYELTSSPFHKLSNIFNRKAYGRIPPS